jgi:16S rRNA (cytosine1402-N4)-methyltransferase
MMAGISASPHYPVMLPEVLAALAPADGEVHVDGTFGAGGYSTALLGAATIHLYAIDRDRTALARGEALAQAYGHRFTRLHGCFGEIEQLLADAGVNAVDGIVVDLGVSSMQIDQAERGFSFRFDAPLDMRMDRDGGGRTAADLVNNLDAGDLADIIFQYGEERLSRRIARAIVAARAESPLETTGQLAAIVRAVVPKSPKDTIDPATRTFQALRIAVNDELGELRRALSAAEKMLSPGGRLVIVSFHSLEDGIVKQFMFEHSGRVPRGSRHMPEMPGELPAPSFKLPMSKPVLPTDAETSRNPRARSARLRLAIRTDAPPIPEKVAA